MEKKYELLDETIKKSGVAMHRIRALRDVNSWVKKDSLGGFVESESNLSHDGECWVGPNAYVNRGAVISENAEVRAGAIVTGKAKVYGNAEVWGEHTWVGNNAQVFDNAKVGGGVVVTGNAKVHGNSELVGYVKIDGVMDISQKKAIEESIVYKPYKRLFNNKD